MFNKLKKTVICIQKKVIVGILCLSLFFSSIPQALAHNEAPPSAYSILSTSPESLSDSIQDATLERAGLERSDLSTFQQKLTGKDLNGQLQNVILDYVGGELSLEQTYMILNDLKSEINSELDKNPKARFTVHIVKDGITSNEEISLKNMIDSLEILNPHYQEHSVTENTRLSMMELRKYFSSRYQTKNNKRWALVRLIINGTVVGIGLWNSYGYLPAAIGVGTLLGGTSGFIQYYIQAFSQFLVNAKTHAGEYARWYVTEIAVSSIFILGPVFFNIMPDNWLSKILIELPLICLAAMGAQGALDVYRSHKLNTTIKDTAIGTRTLPGENERVFQRGELLGLDIFKWDADKIRQQIRPRDYQERESASKFFVSVSMAWAMLTVIGLAGENLFSKIQMAGMEISFSSVMTYGGFLAMGLSAVHLSRKFNSNRLQLENPEWTSDKIKNELNKMRKEFWAYMFLDKYLVKEVKALHPDWSIQEVRKEVLRLEKNPTALEQIKSELKITERFGQTDLFEPQAISCNQYFL